ncbi:MAG TPA: polymer-forming cytoskeletal protein [Holophagaceae bacterium]|jgi:cytoskeletal protein CcmA (bactofilin family)|nr:polymer-forming cytoskeletal protein [Holophagaceae bacterium]
MMAMFSNSPQKPRPNAAQAVHTLLGKDTLWKGEIHCGAQSLRIEGRIEGSIHSTGEVTVAPNGYVEGTIHAKHLIVTGKVKGMVKIAECLEIHGTGLVEGEAEVGSLVVDEGGTLEGRCTRRDGKKVADAKAADIKAATGPVKNGAEPVKKA